MRHPGLAIVLILVGATMMAFAGFTWGLFLLVAVLVFLPPKYDPAIQLKERNSKQEDSQ